WGLLAEFDGPSALVAAAARVREAGYKRIDAHTPFPLEELPEALGVKRTVLPLLVLLGGLLGCVGGYFMQYYASNLDYPLNVGGRPMHSWPMFVHAGWPVCALPAAGCRQQMDEQPRYEPLEASRFFPDGQASRPRVEGTVARGELHADAALYTGKTGGRPVEKLPVPLTADL